MAPNFFMSAINCAEVILGKLNSMWRYSLQKFLARQTCCAAQIVIEMNILLDKIGSARARAASNRISLRFSLLAEHA